MSDSEHDPLDRGMFWFNLVGITLACGLIGSFFVLYGNQFLGLIMTLMAGPQWPDH